MEVIWICSLVLHLETQGGNPILKKKHLAKVIEIKEIFDLCDIWKIRKPKLKRFTFGCSQGRLDYLLISNFLQKTIIRADVLASFCCDSSPIVFTFTFESNNKRGKDLWKFNKSLLSNDECTNKFKNHISESMSILDQNSVKYDQIRWQYTKFKIR